MKLEEYEALNPTADFTWKGKKILYGTPNRVTLWRVKTLLSKEPATIQWLEEIKPGERLLDVGANVGMYSLFAAVCQGANVAAFEPESQNYAQLNKNIYINAMQNQIRAFCLGCSDESGFQPLYLSEFQIGSSCHSIGAEVGFDLQPRPSPFLQGSFSVTIDEAVFSGSIPIPNHIKIDVDGYEHKVLKGAVLTLSHQALKSVLIELNPHLQEHREIVGFMEELGFAFDPDQVAASARKEGPFQGVGEWIFRSRSTDTAEKPKLFRTQSKPSFTRCETKEQAVMDHVLKRIKETEIDKEIFPIAVVDNVFPEEYYRQILEYFPADDLLTPLSETGRVGTNAYRERLVALFNEDHFNKLQAGQRDFWTAFGSWLYSDRFIQEIVEYFKDDVMSRLEQMQQKTGMPARLQSDALLVSDHTQYSIGPHTDAPHRLISFLFYLPANESKKHLGTSLYVPLKEGFKCIGGPHHRHEDFRVACTIEYLPNRLVIFPKTNISFHGVQPIKDPDPRRHLLINNIRLMDA
jgi:FkbM family methyltransferase